MPPSLEPDLPDGERAGTRVAPAVPSLGPGSSRYLPGAVLSRKYRLDSVLGEGGMGAVWQGTNLQLELPVALKLIRADLDRGALRARLQIEARAAAKLGHPAIVRVFDVGESELGDPYIVMELLHGETLAKLITRGRLSAARAVQLALPIVDALSLAHRSGIVHRDLKPDNIMLSVEQQRIQPKILDFGIAKLTDPRDGNHKLTEVGVVVGSPDYMSPEQARGRDDVDAGTDIWSMCVVLYEAITGTAPFNAANYNALLRSIVEDAPLPLSEHAAGDAALWAIIERGLAKDRSQRYASIADLGTALAGWLLSHGVLEDACGASLEGKWFGRTSDPHLEGYEGGPARAISNQFASNVTRDSRTSGVGIDSRGPFTATIRPSSTRRNRNVGLALGGVALLALAGVGVFRSSRAAEPSPALAQAALLAPPLPSPPAAPPPAVDPAPAVESAIPDSPTPEAKQAPVAAAPAKRVASPAKSAPKAVKPAAPSKPADVVAAPPPAKPTPRPLDLLAPY
jgi:serine/threonine-protein kinase